MQLEVKSPNVCRYSYACGRVLVGCLRAASHFLTWMLEASEVGGGLILPQLMQLEAKPYPLSCFQSSMDHGVPRKKYLATLYQSSTNSCFYDRWGCWFWTVVESKFKWPLTPASGSNSTTCLIRPWPGLLHRLLSLLYNPFQISKRSWVFGLQKILYRYFASSLK